MSDSPPADKRQLLKSLLYPGYPIHEGLTTQEATLRTVSQGLQLMRDRLPRTLSPHSTQLATIPPAQKAPIVHVNVPDPSLSLAPQLGNIARAQEETSNGLAILADKAEKSLDLQEEMAGDLEAQTHQGNAMIRQGNTATRQRREQISQTRLAVNVLESLDEQGRQAYLQRLALLGGLYETHSAIERVGANLGAGLDRVNANLLGLQTQGTVSIAELKRHTVVLDDIARLERSGLEESRAHTVSLQSIDSGIQALGEIGQEHTGILQGIGGTLSTISGQLSELNVIAAKSADHLAHMEGSTDLVVITNRRIREALENILDVLKGPVRTKALDLWSIGDQCRKAGNITDALRKLKESMDENPAEPRNYFSLGMLCLEIGAVEAAHDFFSNGFSYANQHDPVLASDFLLQMARLRYLRKEYSEAEKMLERGLSLHKTNIDIWYELALVEMKLNNPDRALYFLKALVHYAKQKAPGYLVKIKNDPEFASIISQLTL